MSHTSELLPVEIISICEEHAGEREHIVLKEKERPAHRTSPRDPGGRREEGGGGGEEEERRRRGGEGGEGEGEEEPGRPVSGGVPPVVRSNRVSLFSGRCFSFRGERGNDEPPIEMIKVSHLK